MKHPRRPLALVAVLLAALLLALAPPGPSTAQARVAPPPKVAGVTTAGQDWAGAKLRVRWRAIPRASYHVRWGRTSAALVRARIHRSAVASATSPALTTRCVPWYVQVRAVRNGRVGPWSAAQRVRFATGAPGVPSLDYSAEVQTSASAARVTWGRTPYVARYRLDWSAAPNGYWSGFAHNYTAWQGATSSGVSVPVPPVAKEGDRFLAPAYGNPVYGQVNYDNGCTSTYRKSGWFGFFPKAPDPGPGDTVAFGTYNLGQFPTSAGEPRKINNVAANVASQNLDLLLLQESKTQTAEDLISRLTNHHGQGGWDFYGVGAQQILWRTSEWQSVPDSGTNVGRANDGSASTPLITPAIELAPADGVDDPARQHVFVVSVHLEDARKFNETATVRQRKAATNAAARILIDQIDEANTAGLPVLVGGDFKGSFSTPGVPGSGFCDESNNCVGEGQPTFIRAGYWDSRTAVVKAGFAYSTVNKSAANPPRNSTGVGARTDFLIAKGAGGFTTYRNVLWPDSSTDPADLPDHNLVVSRVVIPRLP